MERHINVKEVDCWNQSDLTITKVRVKDNGQQRRRTKLETLANEKRRGAECISGLF